MSPPDGESRHARVRALAAAGELEAAEALLEPICASPEAEYGDWLQLARVRLRRGDAGRALAALGRAGAQRPHAPEVANAVAEALVALGRPDDAARRLRRQLERTPDDAPTHANLAWLEELGGRLDAALIGYDRALALEPGLDRARLNRAALHLREDRAQAALADYDVLVARSPQAADFRYGRAECLRRLGRWHEAADEAEQALALAPGHLGAMLCRAIALASLGEIAPAQALFDAAWSQDARGVARYAGQPDVDPAPPDARAVYVHQGFERLHEADWRGYDALVAALERYAFDPERPTTDISFAFPAMFVPISPAASARIHAAVSAAYSRGVQAPAPRPRAASEPLRVGYVSSRFGPTPLIVATGGVYAAHDRRTVSVYAYALNPDDGSPERAAVAASADHFVDLSTHDDAAAAERIRADGIDVLVDLMGFSNAARPALWARRPAPVQVAFLGHAHSLHAEWIDYRITDRVSEPGFDDDTVPVIPEARAYLPGTFYLYDERRRPRGPAPPRAALGLPSESFVFACFNRVEKIEPAVFDAWAAILREVGHAVLWLLDPGAPARAALGREASARGIDPSRLVFAPRTDHGAHVNRQQAADLLLDTFVHGSHTTGLEGLEAGVPLLTLRGDSLSRRIVASFLAALDEPSLVCEDVAGYVERAISLARAPGSLAEIRARIAARVAADDPFATARAARLLESAYAHMLSARAAGLPPADFDVNPA